MTMTAFDSPLPIDDALPALTAALRTHEAAVLVAPPGAGKTTRVPLVLKDEPWAETGKIIVLEPRRLAARAAAERMAKTLGETVGETVGLRVRFGSKVSKATKIEVVTEGIFTRMILDDPELSGYAAVLFDEFHERSLDADLGLAFARDAQQGLREDLKILVMSATLDGARVARLLGEAPQVESLGRAFPVETQYLGRDARAHIEPQVADAVMKALRAEPGSLLVFLPGQAEIRRTEMLVKERLLGRSTDENIDVVALYGALDAQVQDRAISPSPSGRRKVVLATSIAETSLTIEGVRVVIDSGLARVPRFEPGVGLTRLETVRVSRAAADQRRGRAGRTEPGVCYRLWSEPETVSLEAFARPEILSADLSSFALDLAQWGVSDPAKLAFLDPPPQAAYTEARKLLMELSALDDNGRITDEGRSLRALPLPPRLARMVVDAARENAGELAADIAVIVTERGLGGNDVDVTHRVDQFWRDRSRRADEARRMARRWASSVIPGRHEVANPESRAATGSLDSGPGAVAPSRNDSVGAILSLAYPDRVAKNRGGGQGGFLLANGRGATLDPALALAREPFIVAAELSGTAAQARILLAAPISLADIEQRFADRIEQRDDVTVDPATLALRARKARRLGAIVFSEQIASAEPSEENAIKLADAIAAAGLHRLPWSKHILQWRDRVTFLRKSEGDEWPDLSNEALTATVREWLAPLFSDKTALKDLGADELSNAVMALLPWTMRRRLDAEAPTHFEAPTGTQVPIDYEAEAGPTIAIRVQELFGLSRHPSIADGRVPLVIELLSPAHRPVQVTRDLPGFWQGSYGAVKSDMRGRYPKHPWPDDPANALPTRRAKRPGT
ncbi:ATP-dependent helicase HrpB [Pseudorhodoplanes sinuspersici]|uniref:ATP-dependent helicase HrpB n=1 Tax=Pseudorhodoplanes sinuspersici TaxID=1235591 RepID=A0A1W6ZN53_9HYPH|nr:ATP-dependent helicase HrpB [Pseudorhodoplanes sinuspersici]ARP98806.1 ATP-dependent helicase HrpB [Pseudorhodoplanes sinuspersici]RKE69576.1 ATP-dependent helicase HrpB [Pseudorhodoplanes sinuspersici]